MSRVRSQVVRHDENCAARLRGARRIAELWSDRVEHRFERDVLDRVDAEDRVYGLALQALDMEFDRAAKLLGKLA